MGERRGALKITLLAVLIGALPACAPSGYRVGDTGPGGGTVFYVSPDPFPCGPDLASFCNHLEVAPRASEVLRAWALELTPEKETPGADRSAVGAGAANTRDIVAHLGGDPATGAAAYADAYEQDGFTDWYLPSKEELFELYVAREQAGVTGTGTYWSSTDYAFITAWSLDFASGPLSRRLQVDQTMVLPIRAF